MVVPLEQGKTEALQKGIRDRSPVRCYSGGQEKILKGENKYEEN